MFNIQKDSNGFFYIDYDGCHLPFPNIQVGKGFSKISSYRGNYKFKEKKISWLNLKPSLKDNKVLFKNEDIEMNENTEINVSVFEECGFIYFEFKLISGSWNRFCLSFPAEKNENIFGGGEQYSFFNLRGHRFPIFTREQGVGRDYKRLLTVISQIQDKSGGAYYTTYYPQPTFVSSKNYFIHVFSFDYMMLDFRSSRIHKIISYSLPEKIALGHGSSLMDTASQVSKLLGRQAPLPSWVHDGVILGVQGGTETVKSKLEKALSANVKVNAVWAQDWSGKIITSFGKRVYWNWMWNSEMYPGLDKWIQELEEKNICFLSYINPYLIREGSLCKEASEKGFLVKNKFGEDYYIDFGEFFCGHVDLTNPNAFLWYKNKIKENMINLGIKGWMADFGEYLPTDSMVYNGLTGIQAHNIWPGLWARLNYEVLKETDNLDKVIFFMRSGNAMSPKYAQSIWAGDQNVDWSSADGIKSVIPAALSLAYSGHGISFSDIGGYTTLLWLKRTKELLIRWLQLSCFSPVMRTHEGNRPQTNWQFDTDDETLSEVAYWTNIHVKLKKYIEYCEKENAEDGFALIRPMNWYSNEKWAVSCVNQYMLGSELLVAPILNNNSNGRKVKFPKGKWIHLFNHDEYTEGTHFVASPLNEHTFPVFFRLDGLWNSYFSDLLKS